jgi:hypothetical protein
MLLTLPALSVSTIPWQDFVLVTGGLIGLTATGLAASDPETAWARRSSLPKSITLFATSYAMWTLGLPLSSTTAFGSGILWGAIGIWRTPPDDETT